MLTRQIRRAGVIPYTIKNDELYFMMGIDYASKDLTDFGGGVKVKESLIEGAFREFQEETIDVFPSKIYDPNQNYTIVQNEDMMIIFLPVMEHWLKKAKKNFYHKRKKIKNREIYNFVWLNEPAFRLLLDNKLCIYTKVSKFLRELCNNTFYETLKKNW